MKEKTDFEKEYESLKTNKSFPVFYSCSTLERTGSGYMNVFVESKLHKTSYYQVYPFYKSMVNDKLKNEE